MLKPIEKPMKEYLDNDYVLRNVKQNSGDNRVPSDWIEVPEGMNFAHKDDYGIHFTKIEMGYRDSIVIWQREMKEYLVKENGEYVLHQGGIMPSGAIEVPEGAEVATKSTENLLNWWKGDGKLWLGSQGWEQLGTLEKHLNNHGHIILWQRHTQPEELPFVDDEPKLNTLMMEAERGFKREQCLNNAKNKGLLEARDVKPVVVDLSEIQKTFSSEPELTGLPTRELQNIKYMNGSAMGKTESLNDTYAEIEKVRQSGRTAEQINQTAMQHIIERGKTYDSATGERSAHKTALAFNAITGHNINEAEVFLLLQILKDVRQWSKDDCHQDSAEDAISYAVLKAEALERNK